MQKDVDCRLVVAVKSRPLSQQEVVDGRQSCFTVTPNEPQIQLGHDRFTYDYVYKGHTSDHQNLVKDCIAPLVDGVFNGYNATMLAYGQTGSGKTFTMGSFHTPDSQLDGVIPWVINALFHRIRSMTDVRCTVRVSFVEIYKEKVKDLLCDGDQSAVTIREEQAGTTILVGATDKEVHSASEAFSVLAQGTGARTTGATNMNQHSSRSHAVFTITLEQRRLAPATPCLLQLSSRPGTPVRGQADVEDECDVESCLMEDVDAFLCAKMHLVDLAGSEQAKRAKTEGTRFEEGKHINQGLLTLGNVVTALVNGTRYVPYRDSRLTWLLKDSLGGNSRSVLLACISPADADQRETVRTLRYADRARRIKNKPVANCNPNAAALARLHLKIEQLKAENEALRREREHGSAKLVSDKMFTLPLEPLRYDTLLGFEEIKAYKDQLTDEPNAVCKQEGEQQMLTRLMSELLPERKESASLSKDQAMREMQVFLLQLTDKLKEVHNKLQGVHKECRTLVQQNVELQAQKRKQAAEYEDCLAAMEHRMEEMESRKAEKGCGMEAAKQSSFRAGEAGDSDLQDKIQALKQQKDGAIALREAVVKGDLRLVESLLKESAEYLHSRDENGFTPLHWAAGKGQVAAAKLLFKHEADVDARDEDGCTPLHRAVIAGDTNLVKHLLLADGYVCASDKRGRTPLHMAADQGNATVSRLLLQHNAMVDARDVGGWSPLHVAADKGHLAVVKLLLLHNANQTAKEDQDGRTATQCAAGKGHTEVVNLLLKHNADASATDRNGTTAANVDEAKGEEVIVKFLRKPQVPGSPHCKVRSSCQQSRWPTDLMALN